MVPAAAAVEERTPVVEETVVEHLRPQTPVVELRRQTPVADRRPKIPVAERRRPKIPVVLAAAESPPSPR
jgi:hypothetical protein